MNSPHGGILGTKAKQTLIDFPCTGSVNAGAPLRCAFGVPRQTLVAVNLAQVRPILEAVDALSKQGYWCVGYVSYEAGAAFDPAFEVHEAQGPLVWFGVYDAPLAWPESDSDDVAHVQWHERLSRPAFDEGMRAIHHAITVGELYQLNYTAQMMGQLHQGTPVELFMALRRAQPGGYAAFIDTGEVQVLSVSPELFFDWDGERILTRPMKGTAPRGSTPEEDAALAAQLHASPKERAENVMIVDLIRNDLSRVAQPFSVRVPHLFQLQALPSVWQMTSDVEARTRAGTTLADVFAALFPCGSITGAPKVSAMQMIRRIEPGPRGVYCGAVGVVRPGGSATFNVAIRTVTLTGGSAHCGIGSGITADATADGEWQEWRHKRAFLVRASSPFELLETIALQDGNLRHGHLHLARLARAAAHFDFPLDVARLEVCLLQVVVLHPNRLWRVRLRVNSKGQVTAEAFALEASPGQVKLLLAAHAFEEAGSEFVRFKTTRRAHYDAYAPQAPGVFDTLLWNHRGELTECTRGNVAVELDGRWVTPPLHCGLLDGVGRAHHLSEGRLVEAVVHVKDLPYATGLVFVNSLRGWVDAVRV